MRVSSNNFLVRGDLEQKQSYIINGIKFDLVPNRGMYAQDGKETHPILAEVIVVGDNVPLIPGEMVLLHHNALMEAIYKVEGGSVLTYDHWCMATVNEQGELIPTPENIIAKRIRKTPIVEGYELPDSAVKYYEDRVQDLATGEIVGILKWADYEVVYNWGGEERRRIVIWKQHIISRDMKPTGNHVLVLPDPAQDKVNGYDIPETAKQKPKRGTVMAVGDGVFDHGVQVPMTCKVGDNVLYSKFAGTVVEVDGQEMVVLKDYPDVLLIID